MRLVLAALVVFTHAFYLGGFRDPEWLVTWSRGEITAGHFAVQCFFVLSGWLVATSWRRQPVLGRFLWHRFLRLAPALWTCLAVTAFVLTPLVWLKAGGILPFFSLDPSPGGYVWHNLVFPRSQIAVGPFPTGGSWNGDWNGSLWTLFYEWACYLMAAGLGLAGLLTRGRALGTAAIAALLLLHPVVAGLPAEAPSGLLHRLYDTPGKLLTLHFLAGAAWAAWPRQTADWFHQAWPAFPLLAALVLSWHYPVHAWLSPLVLPVIVLMLAQSDRWANFEQQVGGDYSYGLYLYAYPAQQLLAGYYVQQHGFPAYLAAGLALGLVFAVASWHLVEKPALRLKSLPWPRLTPATPS